MSLAMSFDGANADAHSRRWLSAAADKPRWYADGNGSRWWHHHRHAPSDTTSTQPAPTATATVSSAPAAATSAPSAATSAPAAATSAPATQAASSGNAINSAGLLYSYSSSDSASLSIRTQEGDVVRIALRTDSAITAEAAAATDGEQLVAEAKLSAGSSTSVGIYVRGNLNADELKAISDVVGQAADLAGSFFSGNLGQAFDSAASLSIDAQQLASVGLRFSAREQFDYTALQSANPAGTTDTSGTAGHADAAGAAGPDASSNSGLQQITEFLRSLLQPPAGAEGDSAPSTAPESVSLRIRIVQMLTARANASASTDANAGVSGDATASPGSQLLHATLDQLAANQNPPLSASA